MNVPANLQHLQKHLGSIAQRANAGAFAVSPGQRDLHDLNLPGQIEEFRIEAPSFNSLQRENCFRGSTGERFESALRVFEIQTQYYAEQQVENSPEELPVERLTLSLKIAAQPA